ncbi:MAG: glycosyltransferase family 4 protein [Bacteroidales bacterium]|nr:glycosyltransferase family 4 protein [Bacteroidales bacterium]
MKVALINSYYFPDEVGGAEVIVREQAHSLSSRGYDVFVVCLGRSESIIEEELSGIRVYRVPFCNRYWPEDWASHSAADHVLWQLKDRYNRDVAGYVKGIILSERPQLAICHNLSGLSVSVWDVLSKAGVKILQYVHDQYLVCLKSVCYDGWKYCEKPCLKCTLAKFGARKQSSGVNGFVAVSNYVAERLLSLGYFRNVPYRVIHNARNLLLCSRRYDTLDVLTIGYIGAVSRVKGVHVLIEAFMSSGIDARLLIAGHCGDKVYDEELRSMCGSNKRIEFLGYMNSADFYDRIDCLVVPSLWPDTFPTVAFESCAAGVPVVASNIGGLPEIVKDGVNGFLFEPGNASALSSILRRLSDDRIILSAMSANCPSSVSEMTDTELMYNKLEDFINDIC